MANIRENQKNGKTVSYRFTACMERDANGKQVRKYTTWTPPADLSPAKAKKAAERAADEWERETRAEYQKEKEAKAAGRSYSLPPEKRRDGFVAFVNDVWLPLQVRGGNIKPSTVAFYEYMAKPITEYFGSAILQEIGPIEIQKYLIYLRTEHKTKRGQPLSPKTLRHQYVALSSIFNYAEKQGMIAANPMEKLDAPKKDKKPVEALTQEQAAQFFQLLPSCPLDFRCVLYLLITTGIRRGECMGLKWRDIDEQTSSVRIERNISYTPASGVIVNTPKTANSVQTIPVIPSVLQLLLILKQETQRNNPRTVLENAFLFPSEKDIFAPRDPNSVTRRVKRFMKKNGLPDLSPHDLRHTFSTLALQNGVDIKTVSGMLGHYSAGFTLDTYAHVTTAAQKEAAKTMGSLLSGRI